MVAQLKNQGFLLVNSSLQCASDLQMLEMRQRREQTFHLPCMQLLPMEILNLQRLSQSFF